MTGRRESLPCEMDVTVEECGVHFRAVRDIHLNRGRTKRRDSSGDLLVEAGVVEDRLHAGSFYSRSDALCALAEASLHGSEHSIRHEVRRLRLHDAFGIEEP